MRVEELIQKLFDAEQKIIKLEAAQEQAKQGPVAYNHHFIQDDDFMPEEVLSHSPAIPLIHGCKYAGKTDCLYTSPPNQEAEIAELKARVKELEGTLTFLATALNNSRARVESTLYKNCGMATPTPRKVNDAC